MVSAKLQDGKLAVLSDGRAASAGWGHSVDKPVYETSPSLRLGAGGGQERSGACGLQLAHAWRALQVTAACGPEAEFQRRWSAEEKHGWKQLGPYPNGWSRAVFLPDPSFLPVPSRLSAVFLIPTCSRFPASAVALHLGSRVGDGFT